MNTTSSTEQSQAKTGGKSLDNEQEQDIQQAEPASPEMKRADQKTFSSPSKISSFKDISKKSLLAQNSFVYNSSSTKQDNCLSPSKTFLSPLSSMVPRRNRQEQPAQPTPFKPEEPVAAQPASLKEQESEQPFAMAVSVEVETQASEPATPQEEVKNEQIPTQTESVQDDRPEPEPEQAHQDVKMHDASQLTQAEPEAVDNPFEAAKEVTESAPVDQENGSKEQDEVSDAKIADSESKPDSTTVPIRTRKGKKTRFSIPLKLPLNTFQEPADASSNNPYGQNQTYSNRGSTTQNNSNQQRRKTTQQHSGNNQNGSYSQRGPRDSMGRGQKGGHSGNGKKPVNGTNANNNGKKGDGQAYGRRSELNDYGSKSARHSNLFNNNGSQSYREGGNRRSDASYQQKTGSMTERGQNYGDRDKYYNNKQNNNKDQMTYIKYKTSLCRHFELTKTCSLGDACSFAHGEHEKRSMNDPMPTEYPGRHFVGAVHSNYKTQVCRNFEQTGVCKFQDNCCFAHGDDQLRNLTDPLPPIPREVLLYCPPNMKLLPSHGNIQIIPPQTGDQQEQFMNNGGVFFQGEQQDVGYQQSPEDFMYNPMQMPYYQNQQPVNFNHEPPQPFMNFGMPQHPFGAQPFSNFTPPGQDSSAVGGAPKFQNTFPMPLPVQGGLNQQPQDEKPMPQASNK